MKKMKSLMAGLLALAFVSAASAQTVSSTIIRLTGSSAYRGATTTAIQKLMAANGSYYFAFNGSAVGSATYQIFTGTIAGNYVTIKTSYTGSVGGIQTVSQALPVNYLPTTISSAVNSGTTGGGASGASTSTLVAETPTVALTDVYKEATNYNANLTAAVGASTVSGGIVGVVPFKWVVSKGAPVAASASGVVLTTTSGSNNVTVPSISGIVVGSIVNTAGNGIPAGAWVSTISGTTLTLQQRSSAGANVAANATANGSYSANLTYAGLTNITPQQALALYTNGSGLPLALFSGSPTDESPYVYPTGRDNDSGTRLTAQAETGIGALSGLQQFQPTFGAGVATISATTTGSNYVAASTSVAIVADPGYGYTSAPTVKFTKNPADTGPTVTASAHTTIDGNGSINSIVIDNAGSGYTFAPIVSFTGTLSSTGPAKAAASPYVYVSGGTVNNIQFNNPGTGATATATISGGNITGYAVTSAGSGYTAAPSVVIYTSSTGSGATTSVTLGSLVSSDTTATLWPQININGQDQILGNGGYSSGGLLAAALGASTPSLNGYYIGYLSTGDAATAIGYGAQEIAYNGVYYSPITLAEGLYTFWGYEHVYYRTGAAAPTATVANAIAHQIFTTDATVLYNTLKVSRTSDGGNVSNNY